jgi:hypothetical protein
LKKHTLSLPHFSFVIGKIYPMTIFLVSSPKETKTKIKIPYIHTLLIGAKRIPTLALTFPSLHLKEQKEVKGNDKRPHSRR